MGQGKTRRAYEDANDGNQQWLALKQEQFHLLSHFLRKFGRWFYAPFLRADLNRQADSFNGDRRGAYRSQARQKARSRDGARLSLACERVH